MSRPFVFLLLVLMASCRPQTDKSVATPKELLKKLATINDSLDQNKQIDKPAFWTSQLKQKNFSESNPSLAYIHYQLSKSLARSNAGKAKYHINVALDLIEREKEFDELKFTIYNGAGMIAEAEGKFYQAVYYFNKSAAIIMNDDSLQSKPVSKVICLLNAAQDNNKISQHPKAIQQNKLALKILKTMPDGIDMHYFRAYSQLFTAYTESGTYNADSLLFYLKQLRVIAERTEDPMQLRFTNEHTAYYYLMANQYNQSIHYYKLVKEYDTESLSDNPGKPNRIRNVYITLANLIDLYVQTKQFPEAINLIKEADKLECDNGQALSFYEKSLNKRAKMNYYFAIGNVHYAQKEAEELSELKDNILKNSGIQATEEMATIYQLQSKDRSINTLNRTINYTTQRLENNKLLLLIIGLLALLAISWALLFYFIQRQKRQKQEKEKYYCNSNC